MDSVYTEMGYPSRSDYLMELADENQIPLETVMSIADMLGPNEDFDGLVTALQDYVEVCLIPHLPH